MKDIEKAYIAGFIDGEGCIYACKIKTRNSYTINGKIIIGCTNKEIINKLAQLIGDGTKNVTQHKQKPKWKPMFRLELAQRQGTKLLQKILPYLILKKKQAKLFIELTELKKKSRKWKKYNEKRQEEIVFELKEFNRRGV
ncbi:MAG: hypothetical protein JRI44_14075 [Deltaproteobacteria bacterium]|nr:hypothetical protein [Deltaproteobacteria bacterium]